MELIRRAFSELINDPSRLPVSYKLDGIGYHGFPEALKVKTERRLIDANIVERTYSANIPDTALTLRVECFEYKDFPVYEWTAYFENNSDRKSAVISDFFGINTFVPTEGTVTLYSKNGDFWGLRQPQACFGRAHFLKRQARKDVPAIGHGLITV